MKSHSFKKQFPLNLLSNIAYFIVNVVIGIWLVPYFIRHLGAAGYGLIALAVSVTGYVSLVKISFNSAAARFLTIDIQKKDFLGANRIFNTTFWSFGGLSLALIPVLAIFAYFVPSIFSVPEGLSSQVSWLFFLVFLSFVITIFSSVFNASLFAQNRLDLRNMVDISYVGARTFFVVLLFALFTANLNKVGLAYLLGALCSLAFSVYLWTKTAPGLFISIKDYDKTKLKDILGMSGWLLINQIGALLFLQIDLILCNVLFGALIAGQYAAVILWNVLLRSMAGVFSSVFNPMQLISHANDDRKRLVSMSQRAVKFMALGMAIPVGLLCGFAKPILVYWLGVDYIPYVPLMWIFVSHLAINLAVIPLFGINVALNKVRFPALVTVALGVCNIILAVMLAKYTGLGVFGIAVAGAIVLTLKNVFFTPFYAAHILGISKWTFIKPMGIGVMAMAGVGTTAIMIERMFPAPNLFIFVGYVLSISLVAAMIVWFSGIDTAERKLLLSFLGRGKKNV